MVPLPSECRESKVKYPAPWGGKGGEASSFQGLPWGIDTFHWQGESHPNFETVIGGRHSAYSYREKLEEKVGNSSRQRFVDLVVDGTFDQNRITAPSYQRFRERLKNVLDSTQPDGFCSGTGLGSLPI